VRRKPKKKNCGREKNSGNGGKFEQGLGREGRKTPRRMKREMKKKWSIKLFERLKAITQRIKSHPCLHPKQLGKRGGQVQEQERSLDRYFCNPPVRSTRERIVELVHSSIMKNRARDENLNVEKRLQKGQ